MSRRLIIPFGASDSFDFGGFGADWKIDGDLTERRFSVVHHPLAPRTLAAPLHRHHREDEYSYVVSGKLGALLGDDVVIAEPGAWVFKRREQWHTFWNAGDSPCEIIEVISPAGFENYFREMRAIWPDTTRLGAVAEKYELDVGSREYPDALLAFRPEASRPGAINRPSDLQSLQKRHRRIAAMLARRAARASNFAGPLPRSGFEIRMFKTTARLTEPET